MLDQDGGIIAGFGSSHKFVVERYGTSEVNVSRADEEIWTEKESLKTPKFEKALD